MSEKLKQIEKRIEDAKKRLVSLTVERQELSASLEEKRADHASAILAEKDTSGIEFEVISLQAKISGTQQAHEKLNGILNNLQKEKNAELQSIGRSQAEQAKAESMQLASEIYSLLATCRKRIPDLKEKNKEYTAALKAAASNQVASESRKLNDLVFFLDGQLPQIMAGFPSSIRGEEKFPDRQKQSMSLRK